MQLARIPNVKSELRPLTRGTIKTGFKLLRTTACLSCVQQLVGEYLFKTVIFMGFIIVLNAVKRKPLIS